MTSFATESHKQSPRRIRIEQPPTTDIGFAIGAGFPPGTASGFPPGTSPGYPPGAAPSYPPGTFTGAVLPICGVEVLIVVVRPCVLADVHEANLYVVAFHERFRRTIVLMAQRPDGAPCFYGPSDIMRVLQGLPFELIPWRRWLFRTAPPPSWQLPIPQCHGDAARTESMGSAAMAHGATGVQIAVGSHSSCSTGSAGDTDYTDVDSQAIHTVRIGRPDRTRAR